MRDYIAKKGLGLVTIEADGSGGFIITEKRFDEDFGTEVDEIVRAISIVNIDNLISGIQSYLNDLNEEKIDILLL